jgi:hypothetical protein
MYGYRRPPVEPSRKSEPPDFAAPINFAFRLRQLLGLGARAEAARYLLTANVDAASVADVGRAAGYSKRNTQEALTALHSAGVATLAARHGEQRYGIDRSRWSYLLGLDPDELPIYRDWPTLLGVLRRMLRWLDQHSLATLSDYLQVSAAADLLDETRPELNRAGVVLAARIGGTRSWSDLEDTVKYALFWLTPTTARGADRRCSRSCLTRPRAIGGGSER